MHNIISTLKEKYEYIVLEIFMFLFLFIYFILSRIHSLILKDRKGDGRKERERHQFVAFHKLPDRESNLQSRYMCPDQESNPQPFSVWDGAPAN